MRVMGIPRRDSSTIETPHESNGDPSDLPIGTETDNQPRGTTDTTDATTIVDETVGPEVQELLRAIDSSNPDNDDLFEEYTGENIDLNTVEELPLDEEGADSDVDAPFQRTMSQRWKPKNHQKMKERQMKERTSPSWSTRMKVWTPTTRKWTLQWRRRNRMSMHHEWHGRYSG